FLAGDRFQTYEVAKLTERVNPVAVHGRRAARAAVVSAGLAYLDRPEFLAVGTIEGEDVRRVAHVAHRKNLVADDGHAGEAGPDAGRLERERRAVLGPGSEQPLGRRKAVAIGASELGPVTVGGRDRQHHERDDARGQNAEGGLTRHQGFSMREVRPGREGRWATASVGSFLSIEG